MATWRRAVGAVLAVALLGLAAPAESQPSEPRAIRVEISSGADWTQTGIVVQPGDVLLITADSKGNLLPGGFPNLSPELAPAPDLPADALIGRIGDSPPFLVGDAYKDRVKVAGDVSLRLNYGGQLPQGSILAIVRRQPGPIVANPVGNPVGHVTSSGGDGSGAGNLIDGNLIVENPPAKTVVAVARTPTVKTRIPSPPPEGKWPSGTTRLLPVLALLLVAAVTAGMILQRVSRARTVKRTRALLGVSPSLELAEDSGPGDDLPAEGPAASLRVRLDPGVAHMEEGSEDG